MKKLTALLLCVAMLMVGVVAQAESGYEYTKKLLNEGVSLNGYSKKIDDTNTAKLLALVFDFEDNTITMLGDNLQGEYEGTLWKTESNAQFIALLMTFCTKWTDFEEETDTGYTLVFLIQLGDDNEPMVIASAEDAATLASIIQEWANDLNK